MTSQNAKTELINWRRQLEKLNQPIDAEAWDYAIASIDALDRIKACDAISRHDAIKEIMGQPTELHYPDWYAEQINNMPAAQPERKPGKWIGCDTHPDDGRSVFVARGRKDFMSVCIGYYDHNSDVWYEERNWFAKILPDPLFWCEMPELPNCGADMNRRVGDPGANGT